MWPFHFCGWVHMIAAFALVDAADDRRAQRTASAMRHAITATVVRWTGPNV
jgi:hypothetical protein